MLALRVVIASVLIILSGCFMSQIETRRVTGDPQPQRGEPDFDSNYNKSSLSSRTSCCFQHSAGVYHRKVYNFCQEMVIRF